MGIITIAFDDGYKDTFDNCAGFLAELGIKATFAVPAGFIGSTLEGRPVIDLARLTALKDMGHEIASHTTTHRNLLDLSLKDGPEAVKNELYRSKKQLEALTGSAVKSFVFPFIEANSTPYLRHLASEYYSSCRTTTETFAFNPLPVKDPYSVMGVALTTDFSINDYAELVDIAASSGLWLMEVFHLISDKNTKSAHRDAPYRFYMRPDDFKTHISYIRSKGIPIMTQREVIERPS